MPDFNPTEYAVPGFVALVLLEMLWARRHRRDAYEARDTLTSLAFGLGSTVSGLLFGGAFLALFLWVWQFRLFDVPWSWWGFALCFVLDDLKYYWVHRFGHRVRWFWASHVNHHSSQHYNLSTALRQSWTGFLTLGFVFALPLVLLGSLSRATLMRVRVRLMSAGKLGKGLLGAAFILIGVAIVSGADKRVEAALVEASPQWLTDLTTSF